MNYRSEIDGLRALAVLAVIFFHAGFESFSGGFVGVDIFFVISGYLITAIILADIEQGKFSIFKFYERRARRILPALFVVMLACIPFAWLLLSPSDLTSFSKTLSTVPLFISNFFFWSEGGYFEAAAELKPLLHTWSLAVEEQYYVLFPLFMMFFWKLARRYMLITLGLVFLASLGLAQWAAYAKPVAAFYLLPARVWELLVGAFAAIYLSKDCRGASSKIAGEVAGWLGVAFIFYSFFAYSKATPFPSFYTLVPTLGALLIILFASQQNFVGKFVGNKVFVGLGLISYSAYLWHQPILAFARYWMVEINFLTTWILISLIIILSILSWKYVEAPFRSSHQFKRKDIFIASFMGSVFFIAIGYLSSKIEFNKEDVMAKALSENHAIYSSNINERNFVKNRIIFEKNQPAALVIGSSRIMQASSTVAEFDLLNLSVSGASVEDLITIWYLSSKKFSPEYVFIGADPWIFNLNSGQSRWNYLSEDYKNALASLGINKQINPISVKSQSYFSLIANRFYDSVNHSKIVAEDDAPSVVDKIRKDGSRVYNLSYTNKSADEVERGALNYISYAMNDFIYSYEVEAILVRFVSELKRENRKVIFVLSPYHPKLFDLMRFESRNFLEIESKFREIAKSSGVEIIGSYDPNKVGCSFEHFYDGMHPKDKCINKVFSQLKNQPR